MSGIVTIATEGGQKGFNEHLAAARDAVKRALALEPDLPDALLSRAMIETNFDSNWKGRPRHCAKLWLWRRKIQRCFFGPEVSPPARREAAGSRLLHRGGCLRSGECAGAGVSRRASRTPEREARAEFTREIELNPSAPNSYAAMGVTYLLQGKFEEAATVAQKDSADWARLLTVSCARWGQKRVPESDAALAELIAKRAKPAPIRSPRLTDIGMTRITPSSGWSARAGNATPAFRLARGSVAKRPP